MYVILIIICNLVSCIIIISNCFIFIVLYVKLPSYIMCAHLFQLLIDTVSIDLACSTLSTLPKAPCLPKEHEGDHSVKKMLSV